MEKREITAEEFAMTIYQPIGMTCNEFAIKLAVGFAREKVKEALEKAAEAADLTNESFLSMQEGSRYEIDKESILKSYDINSIN